MRVASPDDLQQPLTGLGDVLGHLRPPVAGIGEDALDEGKGAARRLEQGAGAVAILHIGGVDDDAQEQAERIDEDVTLAAGDLLARIETLRVERRAPF